MPAALSEDDQGNGSLMRILPLALVDLAEDDAGSWSRLNWPRASPTATRTARSRVRSMC